MKSSLYTRRRSLEPTAAFVGGNVGGKFSLW